MAYLSSRDISIKVMICKIFRVNNWGECSLAFLDELQRVLQWVVEIQPQKILSVHILLMSSYFVGL